MNVRSSSQPLKNLTQSLSNQESLNRTVQEQAEAYQEKIKNSTDRSGSENFRTVTDRASEIRTC